MAQSIRPDLLETIVQYVNRLMIETHALPRSTKELIAAYTFLYIFFSVNSGETRLFSSCAADRSGKKSRVSSPDKS
ncbi:Uncharacterized protein dnm_089090 [Desulfonema magnum]|uniref:Uncharacterized protein n=1 Tax=Desulfonema magnum TaxID=45655 RepID=A0A975GT82_9BACT|nr:Uncharacterized protein dnm_089090 [Desulfonema magnum]